MGSCSSCADSYSHNKHKQVWKTIPKSLGRISGCPYQERVRLCKVIQKSARRKDFNALPRQIQRLRYVCGLDLEKTSEAGRAVELDDTGRDLIQSLTRLINIQGPNWDQDAVLLCDKIKRHYSPASKSKKKKIPDSLTMSNDLTDIDITFVNLSVQDNISQVRSIIQSNPELQSIKMNYTKLDDEHIGAILHDLARLKHLAYISLVGNRLDKLILEKLYLIMCRNDAFPSLLWVDLRNNKHIFVMPTGLVNEFRDRWPPGSKPNLRELANGQPPYILSDLQDIEEL